MSLKIRYIVSQQLFKTKYKVVVVPVVPVPVVPVPVPITITSVVSLTPQLL